MKIRFRCKTLDLLRVDSDEGDIFVRNFDFLAMGYSKVFDNYYAYLNILGFQASIEWGEAY